MAIRDVERLKRELDAARGGVTFPSYGGYAPAPAPPAHQPAQQSHQARPVPAVNVSGPGGVGVGKQQALPGSSGQPAHPTTQAAGVGSQVGQQVPASLSAAAAAAAAQSQTGQPGVGAKPESNGPSAA